MLPTSALYRSVLPTPHKREFRIDVTDIDGLVRATDLHPIGGEVRAALVQRVTRTATFEMPGSYYPITSDDILSPEFAIVRISAGIGYGNGLTELFPIFTGRVIEATLNPEGTVTFQCDDLAADVLAARFEQPRTSSQPTTIAEIHGLITEAVPQAVFGTDNVTDTPTPLLTWDEDRGNALDDLAGSLGGRWYTLGDGSFVVRSFAYDSVPVLATYADGPQGVMTSATIARSRNGAFNSVVVVSERTDGSAPVRVPARVTDPADPLFYGGRYGRVSQIIKVQTPLTGTQAQVLAKTQLDASAALREQWAFSIVPDMALEPGDTVAVGWRGRTGRQVVDSVVYPLDNKVNMSVVGRTAVEVQ